MQDSHEGATWERKREEAEASRKSSRDTGLDGGSGSGQHGSEGPTVGRDGWAFPFHCTAQLDIDCPGEAVASEEALGCSGGGRTRKSCEPRLAAHLTSRGRSACPCC